MMASCVIFVLICCVCGSFIFSVLLLQCAYVVAYELCVNLSKDCVCLCYFTKKKLTFACQLVSIKSWQLSVDITFFVISSVKIATHAVVCSTVPLPHHGCVCFENKKL